MKAMAKVAVVAAWVILIAGLVTAEGAEGKAGMLAGRLSIHVAGTPGETIYEGIEIVFLEVTTDGPQDVAAAEQPRLEAVTDKEGYYFIKNVDLTKNYQIRQVTATIDGRVATYSPSYTLGYPADKPQVDGTPVLWHALDLQYSAGAGFAGMHKATVKMDEGDANKVRAALQK